MKHSSAWILAWVALAAVALAGVALAGSAEAANPVAVTMETLAGDWLLSRYAEALMATRSPLAATKVVEPLGLVIRDHGGQRELTVTSFHESLRYQLRGLEATDQKATLVLAPAEPGEPEAPAESWRRVDVELRRHADGVAWLHAAFWGGGEGGEDYQLLPRALALWVNRLLLVGEYRDGQGRGWRFFEQGSASTPDESFPYQVSLDISETDCDYFQTPDQNEPGGQRRIGFAWKGEALHLFRVRYDRPAPISCEQEPWVVLKPVP